MKELPQRFLVTQLACFDTIEITRAMKAAEVTNAEVERVPDIWVPAVVDLLEVYAIHKAVYESDAGVWLELHYGPRMRVAEDYNDLAVRWSEVKTMHLQYGK